MEGERIHRLIVLSHFSSWNGHKTAGFERQNSHLNCSQTAKKLSLSIDRTRTLFSTMDIVNNSGKLPDLQDIPAYVRPYNYMPSNNVNGYGYYSFASSQRLPTLTFSNPSSPDDLDLDLPPRKKMNGSAQPTYMPPVPPSRDLFRPVDFEARHAGATNRLSHPGARKPELPFTPSGSSSPEEQRSGTSSVLGKDATYCADGISVCLQEADLWRAFHQEGNEMIVTKPGR